MSRKLPKYYRRKTSFSEKIFNSQSCHRYLFIFTLIFFITVFVLLIKQDDIEIPQKSVTIEINVKDQINNSSQ